MIQKFILAMTCLLLVAGCNVNESLSEPKDSASIQLPETKGKLPIADCKSAPMVKDLTKLEPLLKKEGLITDGMSEEQKNAVIREYVRKKSSKSCNKGKK